MCMQASSNRITTNWDRHKTVCMRPDRNENAHNVARIRSAVGCTKHNTKVDNSLVSVYLFGGSFFHSTRFARVCLCMWKGSFECSHRMSERLAWVPFYNGAASLNLHYSIHFACGQVGEWFGFADPCSCERLQRKGYINYDCSRVRISKVNNIIAQLSEREENVTSTRCCLIRK